MRINTTDKNRCSGCGACVVACPQNCIRLVPDEEGFDYPVIDEANCTDCGRCLQVCGMQNDSCLHEVQQTYATWHADSGVRAESTSGGAFSALADVMFAKIGLVAGAVFTDDFKNVEHQLVGSWQAAKAFRGSKYVQSRTQTCFADIVKALDQGRNVLFTGTPCQVSSLRRLTGDPDNLTTCDIVCHGVPSPEVFRSYLEEIEQKNNSKVVSYEFRGKHHGWNFPQVVISFENGVVRRFISWADSFFYGFSLNVFLRPSCYRCPFAAGERAGDVTLGDCWRVAASHPQYDDNQGTSLMLVNTEKGRDMVERVADRLVYHAYDFELAQKRAHPLHAPSIEYCRRDIFFSNFKQHKSFKYAASEYFKPMFVMRKKAERVLKRLLWPLLRRFQ